LEKEKVIMGGDQIKPVEAKILIVDDQPPNRDILIKALEPRGYKILSAPSGEIALRIAQRALPDLILLDILMPGLSGFKVCQQLKQEPSTQDIPVIFVTARDETEDVLEGFRLGGVDYITKPISEEEVLVRVQTHLKINRLTKQLLNRNTELEKANEQLRQEIKKREQAEQARNQSEAARQKADEHLNIIKTQEAERWGISGFIGQSKTIQKILDDVLSLQEVDKTSVLILGESGTGKELIARAIHFGSARAKAPFIPVNCSAIPHELAESMLFGHVAGAFTGAKTSRKGYFELADGGTLFLDEIGDMSFDLQTKLLRVLEDGCFIPLGGTNEKHVDVRIIAATNADPMAKIAAGKFREDLYFRLARFPVHVPPLRERTEDIPLLAEHFLSIFSTEMGFVRSDLKPAPTLSPQALKALEVYPFPGNVRELKNIIEHALIKSRGSVIQPEHLNFIDSTDAAAPPVIQPMNMTDTPLIKKPAEASMIEGDSPLTYEEKQILDYVREHGSINNAQCRALLGFGTDKIHRVSRLLVKMYNRGLLQQEGERRGTRYCLP
jgi:DNA-binding NtrC family response regulator